MARGGLALAVVFGRVHFFLKTKRTTGVSYALVAGAIILGAIDCCREISQGGCFDYSLSLTGGV